MATAKPDHSDHLRRLHYLQPAALEEVSRLANMVLSDF